MIDFSSREMSRSRVSFWFQAAFEWLVAILLQTTFLAELTLNLGFTDAQVGIISSIISLGFLFQLISMFFRRGSVKVFSVIVSVLNQVLFACLYVIPSTPLPATVKRVIFVVFIILAYALLNIGNPKIAVWRLSLVEPNRRGRYSGGMQMLSLVMGIIFSFAMGSVVDKFKLNGNISGAFIVCAVAIFLLMIIHSVSLLLVVDMPEEKTEQRQENIFKSMLKLATNKKVWLLAIVFIFYNASQYCAIPFYNTYMINELGMTNVEAQINNAVIGGAISFIIAMPIGIVGDRFSFSKMLLLCFITMCLRTAVIVFATPENGFVCFVIYQLFNAVSSMGALTALVNITMERFPGKQSSDVLAFCQSAGGIAGFGTSLLMSGLVNSIQKNGNVFWGMNVYAQQVVSVIASIVTAVGIAYLLIAIIAKEKVKK